MMFNQMLVREIIHHVADLDQRFYETSVMPMQVRLHGELLRISRRRDGALIISPPPTHQDLASRIGSQREAVSKELGRLEIVIKRGRAAILLVREDQLRREITEWNNEPVLASAVAKSRNEAKFDIPVLLTSKLTQFPLGGESDDGARSAPRVEAHRQRTKDL
jgi:Crp-like helix-turn-helix domain